MIAYSLLPAKPYSKHLLGFAYKKPLFAVIFFVIPLIAVSLLLQSLVGIGIPLNGTSNIAIPIGLMGAGITISFLVTAGFLWPFWLAAVAAGLCLAARIYHKRLTATKETTPQPPSTESASPPPAPACAGNLAATRRVPLERPSALRKPQRLPTRTDNGMMAWPDPLLRAILYLYEHLQETCQRATPPARLLRRLRPSD